MDAPLTLQSYIEKKTKKQNKMKKLNYIGALFAIVIGAQLLTACSGYLVATAPPPHPVEVIVTAPSPRYVWVSGYYSYTGSTYVFIDGSYQIPPRGRTRYVQGQWQQTPKGYKRGKGHWK
jgi:hypothetical protein